MVIHDSERECLGMERHRSPGPRDEWRWVSGYVLIVPCETGRELKTERGVDGICSAWVELVGHLDWSLGPGPQIYNTAQAQHAGTAPLDVGLRQFEFTAMEVVGKSDRQCRLLVRATNLHSCYLSPTAAEQPICAIRAAAEDGSCDPIHLSSLISSHRTAPHIALHHMSRSGK